MKIKRRIERIPNAAWVSTNNDENGVVGNFLKVFEDQTLKFFQTCIKIILSWLISFDQVH